MKKEEINELTLEKRYFKLVFNNGLLCILAVLVCFASLCFLVNEKNGICQLDLGLFKSTKTMPIVLNGSYTAESGGIELTVDGCEMNSEENMLYVSISGKNKSGSNWSADGRTFAIAVQSINDTKLREYYYNPTGDWKKAAAAVGGAFSVKLGFQINNAEETLKEGNVISLVSFSGEEMPTTVIALNDLLDE